MTMSPKKISMLVIAGIVGISRDITEITDNLQAKYSMEVSSRYLDFLMDIVEKYFQVSVPSSQKLVLKLAH